MSLLEGELLAVADDAHPLGRNPERHEIRTGCKRAALAQSHPRTGGIWLLDEPLNGLDAAAAEMLQARVSAHCAGGGIAVIASHQPLGIDGLRRIDLAEFAA